MSRANALLSRTTLAHAVSGSVGSMLAMVLTYPLDRLRTLKQLEGPDAPAQSALAALRDMLRREGWRGVYAGLQPMLVALGASNFIYFYWFTALRAALQYLVRRGRPAGSLADPNGPLSNLLLASVAGSINVLLTTPLWVAYTRLAVQSLPRPAAPASPSPSPRSASQSAQPLDPGEAPLRGMTDALRRIGRDEGAAGLWAGVGPSLILVSNPSVQFASYEWLKLALLRLRFGVEPTTRDLAHLGDVMDDSTDSVVSEAVLGTELSSAEYLLLGATAKMIATVVTYPLQMAQTRMRAATSGGSARRRKLAGGSAPPTPVATRSRASTSSGGSDDSDGSGADAGAGAQTTLGCLRDMYAAEGVQGLYRGMEAKLLQTCLTSAFMFAAYEQICAAILRLLLWHKISRQQQRKL